MPVGFNSPARNLFLLGSSGQQVVTNFFEAIDKSSTTDGVFIPDEIRYIATNKKYALAGSAADSNSKSFGWLERQDYDLETGALTTDYSNRIESTQAGVNTTLRAMELDDNDNLIVVGKTGTIPWIAKYSNIWPIKYGENSQSVAKKYDLIELPTSLKKEQITDQFGDPSTISVWSLPEFIGQLERAGFSAKRYSVWLQSELAKPAFFLAMMLISAAFCMRQTRVKGTSFNVLAAVLVGFLLFYLKNFVLILGINGQLPVLIAAWGPSFAATFISLGLFLNREEG